jgi:FkbM family methyltransferase
MALSGRVPSRRALAAIAKLCGRQPMRRWPFFPTLGKESANLEFNDFLELQYARTRNFSALVIGAFDGVENDPTSEFIRDHRCRAILVEPQPGPFERLRENMRERDNIILINAAIDEVSGFRDMYCVSPGGGTLPLWVEQLASFRKEHIFNQEDKVPSISKHLTVHKVPTVSFEQLLDSCGVRSIDLLQIDTEGMDAQLLTWFPFERIRPALLHYETVHMSPEEQIAVRNRLEHFSYLVHHGDSPMDEIAILF